MEKIAVAGAGAWGTTLALKLRADGRRIILWEKFAAHRREISVTRANNRFLPGFPLSADITVTGRARDLADCRAVVLAVRSCALRETVRALAGAGVTGPFLVATKGLEKGTSLRMSEVLLAETGKAPFAVLSGPNIAREIAAGLPAGAVCAGPDQRLNLFFQALVADDNFRVYTGDDTVGVELGGALKNPLAIAAGICEGLGLGENARATLVCRGLSEMVRLGLALGGRPDTFAGLSGLGDLATTCYSPDSRNHRFGRAIGRGEDPSRLIETAASVVEGYHSTPPALALAGRHGVEMPIISEVARVLFEGKPPSDAVRDLLKRPLRQEFQR